MIYTFTEDFLKMKTTVYTYGERKNEYGEIESKPLSRPLKNDYSIAEILYSGKLNWLFKNSTYGKTLKDITLKARSYSHGSKEYEEIKMHMPGYTWVGTVNKEDAFDEENQEFYEKRCKRTPLNMTLNGLVCIEFDDIEIKDVEDLIQKALRKFPHLILAGRTLSNKLFCMHRANDKITANNYINYFMELAVAYYNELGIKADTACSDVTRMRYICDQAGSRANTEYCDFEPAENVKVEYDKIFKVEKQQYVKRAANYVPTVDENIYVYDENKGFYYGHTKQHLHHIGELIVPVPSIEQIINTLLALGKSCEEIVELWKTTLNYYNYNSNSRNITDNIRLTEKISQDNREFKVGESTYTFLLMFFPQIIGTKSLFLDDKEFLCDRFYKTLLNSILAHKKILIHGDTGIGKTYFANKLGEDKDVIVVVPYIAHMNNYPLYEQIEVKNEMEVVKRGVIIWDRFVKLYYKNLISEDSIIIIDESHKLFLDQTYRQAAVYMNQILHDIKNHICYISATPINEIDVDKTFRFEKNRRAVKVCHLEIIPEEDTIQSSSLTLEAMLHLIYGNLNYYDHIFIASDRFAQKIYDRLYGRYDCQLIRASQKESPEFLELMRDQLLKHKIIIGTCISYESLNFNNKNEKILTISDMNEKTTAHTITQIAGRVRFSYNKVYLIELIQTIEQIDYKEKAEYFNKLEEIRSKYNIYTRKHYVQTYSDELNEVNTWYLENNNINKIKENLPLYIKWEESQISAKNISDKSPLNEQTKKYIIEYLQKYNERFNNTDILLNDDDYYTCMFFNDDNFIKISEEGQSGYIIRENIREQQYSYSKMTSYIDYEKLNKLITDTHTLPNGVNAEILKIIDILKLDENTFNSYINELEDYLRNLYGVYYFALERTIKEIKRNRKTYRNCFDEQDYVMYNNVFDIYLQKRQAIYNRKINSGKIGGKIGGKAKKKCTITDKFKHPEKYNLTIGQEFYSTADLSEYTNKSRETISQWRQKGWIS